MEAGSGIVAVPKGGVGNGLTWVCTGSIIDMCMPAFADAVAVTRTARADR